MDAFSEPHLALLHPLPIEAARLRRQLDRWLGVAWPMLWRWTCRTSCFHSDEERHEAHQWALQELHTKLVGGWVSEVLRDGAKPLGYFARSWRNLLRDWGRREGRAARKTRLLRERLEAERSQPSDRSVGRAGAGDGSDDELATDLAPRAALRGLPITATGRLVLLCVAAPASLVRDDVDAAAGESLPERGDGLARPADETWELLDAWRAEVASQAFTKGERTRRLAFILRGPTRSLDPAAWEETAFRAGRDWLYKQRQRALERARKRVGATQGAER